MNQERTIQNDRIDKVALRVYGSEHFGNVEAVYAANRGLAALGPLLSAGLEILMPTRTSGVLQKQIIRLWS